MQLSESEIKTLQALRAGPMSSAELTDRFPSGHAASKLVKRGLAEDLPQGFTITQQGREKCPTRRSEQPVLLVPIIKKENKVTEPTVTKEPKSHKMLSFIEQNPNCTMVEMIHALKDKDIGEAFIPGYIQRGHVLVNKNKDHKKTYQLAPGVTAKSAIESKGTWIAENKKSEQVTVKAATDTEAAAIIIQTIDKNLTELKAEAAKPIKSEVIPTFAAPVIDMATNNQLAQNRKLKFAFTSDNTLMLFGLDYQPIELDADETERLIEFCDSVSMSIAVGSADHTVGGRTL